MATRDLPSLMVPRGKFEGSKFDNDKGVKEGSAKDRARDKREMQKMKAAKKGRK